MRVSVDPRRKKDRAGKGMGKKTRLERREPGAQNLVSYFYFIGGVTGGPATRDTSTIACFNCICTITHFRNSSVILFSCWWSLMVKGCVLSSELVPVMWPGQTRSKVSLNTRRTGRAIERAILRITTGQFLPLARLRTLCPEPFISNGHGHSKQACQVGGQAQRKSQKETTRGEDRSLIETLKDIT